MWQQSPSIGVGEFAVEALRVRLEKMSDDELAKFGKAARYMCSRKANLGRPPRKVFVIQLDEARAEWRRRHPRNAESSEPRWVNSGGTDLVTSTAPKGSTSLDCEEESKALVEVKEHKT
jgi:hypothetical protein